MHAKLNLTKLKAGSGCLLYAIQSGNGSGLFYSFQSPDGAMSKKIV